MDVSAAIQAAEIAGLIPNGYTIMILSPSQIETHAGTNESCQRQWWFKNGLNKDLRLPTVNRAAHGFGTILHEVAERYLNADDTGRDPVSGEVVDLYPGEWWQARPDYRGRTAPPIPMGEQRLVKALISQAIEDGFLTRQWGRQTEVPFWEFLGAFAPEDRCLNCGACLEWHTEDGDCPTKPEMNWVQVPGKAVFIMGYIDLLTPTRVTDHKSTKNMRYASSAKKLAKDPAMLLYAHKLVQDHKLLVDQSGAAPMTHVELEHIVYLKDLERPKVRSTVASVPVGKVEAYWRQVGVQTKDMVRLTYNQDVSEWRNVPGANEDPRSRACNAYGGCAFATVCGGRETVRMYRNRVGKINHRQKEQGAAEMADLMAMLNQGKKKSTTKPKPATPPAGTAKINPPKPSGSGSKKSRAEALALITGAKPKPPTAPKPAAKPKPKAPTKKGKPARAPRTRDDGTLIVAPWAVDGCNGCKVDQDGTTVHTGISSKGSPCRPCASLSAKNEDVNPTWYDLTTDDKGRLLWTPKPEYAEALSPGSTEELEVDGQSARIEIEPDPGDVDGDDHAAWAAWKAQHVLWQQQNPGVDPEWEWDDPAPPAPKPKPKATAPKKVTDAALVNAACLAGAKEVQEDAPYSDHSPTGVVLYLGCMPLRECGPILLLVDVVAKYGQALAAKEKAKSYYALDAFKRRDAMAQAAPGIMGSLGDCSLVGSIRDSPDVAAFIAAIKPLATQVVCSLSQ